MSSLWILTPTDSALSEMEGWAKIGKNRYAAFRHHLLVKQGGDQLAKNGPIYNQMEWPIDAKFIMVDKITQIVRYTYNIQESITSTITSRLSQEAMSRVGSSFGISLVSLEAKIKSELETRIGSELTNSLQNYLSTTKTYSVETTKEKSESLEFKVPPSDGSSQTRTLFVYFKLRQFFWDIYLYRTEYLQLEYKKRWLWTDIRKTIDQVKLDLRAPLFRVIYHEPVHSFSYCFDRYTPEISDGDTVQCTPLQSQCPPAAIQASNGIGRLAELAFPVTKKEKLAATKSKAISATVSGKRMARRRKEPLYGKTSRSGRFAPITKGGTTTKAKASVRMTVMKKSSTRAISKK
jgi:hypothetical protein